MIIVIVVVSLLLAVAIPRLISVEEDAKEAVLNGALGSLRSTARIAESGAYAASSAKNGIVKLNGRDILLVNGFPAARANNIGSTGPGSFEGILALMELQGDVEVHYSDSSAVVSANSVRDDSLILAIDTFCITYRPPQVANALPEYSAGVRTFDRALNICN